MLDSAIRVNKENYLHTLSKECKYKIKKNKVKNFIYDNLESSSSDNESDNESDNRNNN